MSDVTTKGVHFPKFLCWREFHVESHVNYSFGAERLMVNERSLPYAVLIYNYDDESLVSCAL